MLAIAWVSFCIVSCGGDDDNNDNTNESAITENDPEGTIITNLTHNSSFYLSGTNIYIQMWTNTNFGFYNGGAQVAVVGKVKGLGYITTVPLSGWTDEVAAIPGYGYVVRRNDTYVRIYVVKYITTSTNDIKGCTLKYQVWHPTTE